MKAPRHFPIKLRISETHFAEKAPGDFPDEDGRFLREAREYIRILKSQILKMMKFIHLGLSKAPATRGRRAMGPARVGASQRMNSKIVMGSRDRL